MGRQPASAVDRFASFGAFLKYLRRRAQLTQVDLAVACGYSPAQISRLENNQRLPDEVALLALFVPALGLADEPEQVERLLTLAAASRQKETVGGTGQPEAAGAAPPNNLPVQSTPFIGREKESIRLAELLSDPACRLVTVVGPGGIGKTRLALHAATKEVGRFREGIYFVALASVSSPDYLVSTIADVVNPALGGPKDRQRWNPDEPAIPSYGWSTTPNPTEPEDLRQQLLEELRYKELLLLLDNFEHLLDATELVSDMLVSAPDVKLLVTSRERLNLRSEWLINLEGLEFPGPQVVDSLEGYSAVQLFAQSARQVRADFTLSAEVKPAVADICRVVEGMPLGLELSAVWVQMLPCREIARQIERNFDFLATTLRDVPARHRSLRAVFEHSWSLISNPERQALMKLSVFQGGFSLEAAATVAGAALPILLRLVEKSLVRVNDSGRYDLHELLRQFAAEKLDAAPEEQERTLEQHCAYYAEFLYQRAERLERPGARTACEEIEQELDNVRAAWSQASQRRRTGEIGKALLALCRFYLMQDRLQEGRDVFQSAAHSLENETGERERLVYGQALARQARFEGMLRRYQESDKLFRDALDIFRQLESQRDIAFALNYLGHGARWRQRWSEAQQWFEESLAIRRAIGDMDGVVACLGNLGLVAREQGQLDQAWTWFQESLALARKHGVAHSIVDSLREMGNLALNQGRLAEARTLHQEALAVGKDSGDRSETEGALLGLAWVAFRQAEFEESRQLVQECLALVQEVDSEPKASALSLLASLDGQSGNLDAAILHYGESLTIAKAMGFKPLAVDVLGSLCWDYYCAGDYVRAKRAGQEGMALARELGDSAHVSYTAENLGYAHLGLGEYQEARRCLFAAMRVYSQHKLIPPILTCLSGIARIRAAEGQPEQALALLGLVMNHPSANWEATENAQAALEELQAELPPEMVEAALARGRTLDLEAVVAHLLAEAEDPC